MVSSILPSSVEQGTQDEVFEILYVFGCAGPSLPYELSSGCGGRGSSPVAVQGLIFAASLGVGTSSGKRKLE